MGRRLAPGEVRIRHVDATEPDIEEDLLEVNAACFTNGEPAPDLTGWWWLAMIRGVNAAFCGVRPSIAGPKTLYLSRVGVLPEFRGAGLQRRMMRVSEAWGRRHGWVEIVTETRLNTPSANNMIACGYKLWDPETPWGFQESLYWRKSLRR